MQLNYIEKPLQAGRARMLPSCAPPTHVLAPGLFGAPCMAWRGTRPSFTHSTPLCIQHLNLEAAAAPYASDAMPAQTVHDRWVHLVTDSPPLEWNVMALNQMPCLCPGLHAMHSIVDHTHRRAANACEVLCGWHALGTTAAAHHPTNRFRCQSIALARTQVEWGSQNLTT